MHSIFVDMDDILRNKFIFRMDLFGLEENILMCYNN